MDCSKRAVLISALSAYTDLLEKNAELLDIEQGKGKGKASEDDVDLKIENQNQIRLCAELAESITNASSGKDIARIFDPVGAAPNLGISDGEPFEGLKKEVHPVTTAPNRVTEPIFSIPQQSYVVDDEPYTNPFTGLTVIPETGFEPGPSNKPPPPLREPPRPQSLETIAPILTQFTQIQPTREPPKPPPPPSRPPPVPTEQKPKVPVRPLPKPVKLRASTTPLPQPTSTQPATLPQRRAPPPIPIAAPEPQPLQRILTAPVTRPEYNVGKTSSIHRKSVATEQQTEIPPSQSYHPVASQPPTPYQQQPILSYPFPWETDITERKIGVAKDGGHFPINVHKNKYMNYVAELASKILKSDGGARSARASSVHQSQPLNGGVVIRLPVGLPAEPAGHSLVPENATSHVSSQPQAGRPQRRTSAESSPPAYDTLSTTGPLESLPPAYDALSRTSRRSSMASFTSGVGSSIWTSSPTLSSRTAVSPLSTYSTRSNSGAEQQHHGIWATSPTMTPSSNSSLNPQKRSNWIPLMPKIAPRHRSVSSLFSPSATPGVNNGDTGACFSTSPSTYIAEPSSASPGTKFGIFPVDSGDVVSSPMSSSISPDPDQQMGFARESQSAARMPLSPPGSNNPWKNHMAADEAFARAVLQEEYQEMELERTQRLAYGVANGTAGEEDVELAFFMSRETDVLMSSTAAVAPVSFTPGASLDADLNPWGIDQDELQMQIDWLEAHEMAKEFETTHVDDEFSLAEAKRLQSQFDMEVQADDEWEEWKKSNIVECVVCGDEQHREELIWPCEHGYCDGCLQEGFKNALSSRTPFKCCKKAVSIEGCDGLSTEFIEEYENMMLELSTKNPMYCCNTKCAKFLPPRSIVGDVGTCQKCRSQTCRHCRKRIHPGTFCEEDKETKAVKELAKKKGWKTCPGCNHLIERRDGCLHMICTRCQTAFCYRCSKRWKDCESTCPDAISATHPKR